MIKSRVSSKKWPFTLCFSLSLVCLRTQSASANDYRTSSVTCQLSATTESIGAPEARPLPIILLRHGTVTYIAETMKIVRLKIQDWTTLRVDAPSIKGGIFPNELINKMNGMKFEPLQSEGRFQDEWRMELDDRLNKSDWVWMLNLMGIGESVGRRIKPDDAIDFSPYFGTKIYPISVKAPGSVGVESHSWQFDYPLDTEDGRAFHAKFTCGYNR